MRKNQEVYGRLAELVVEQYLPKINSQGRVTYGPLEINDFSICFWLNVDGENGLRGVYVKIPKHDLFKKKREIYPLTDNDRNLSKEEYRSLLDLSQFWSNDLRVQFIKPLGFVKEYNAIVTERVFATYFLGKYRQVDISNRFKILSQTDRIQRIMWRLGKALTTYHQTSIRESGFSMDQIVLKIKQNLSRLNSSGLDIKYSNKLLKRLIAFQDFTEKIYITKTLKGLDIRNILIDKSENLFLMDPGRMRYDCREADLARFIVTCRITYWGTPYFFLKLSPCLSYERFFLDGYCGDNEKISKVLGILIIKELIKHWKAAYAALFWKKWPQTIKKFLRKTYIDPFYRLQINTEISKLER